MHINVSPYITDNKIIQKIGTADFLKPTFLRKSSAFAYISKCSLPYLSENMSDYTYYTLERWGEHTYKPKEKKLGKSREKEGKES